VHEIQKAKCFQALFLNFVRKRFVECDVVEWRVGAVSTALYKSCILINAIFFKARVSKSASKVCVFFNAYAKFFIVFRVWLHAPSLFHWLYLSFPFVRRRLLHQARADIVTMFDLNEICTKLFELIRFQNEFSNYWYNNQGHKGH